MGEANRREELIIYNIIYNFEEGREAEVVKGGQISFWTIRGGTFRKDFLPWIKICAWTDR